MKVLINDYCGYPFQKDQSYILAKRGHDVCVIFTNASGSNFNPNWAFNLEARNIIIEGGRSLDSIYAKPNLWYIEGLGINDDDLKGNYYYDEEQV